LLEYSVDETKFFVAPLLEIPMILDNFNVQIHFLHQLWHRASKKLSSKTADLQVLRDKCNVWIFKNPPKMY